MNKEIKVINQIDNKDKVNYTCGLFYRNGTLVAARRARGYYPDRFCGVVVQSSDPNHDPGEYSDNWVKDTFIPVEAEIIIR